MTLLHNVDQAQEEEEDIAYALICQQGKHAVQTIFHFHFEKLGWLEPFYSPGGWTGLQSKPGRFNITWLLPVYKAFMQCSYYTFFKGMFAFRFRGCYASGTLADTRKPLRSS